MLIGSDALYEGGVFAPIKLWEIVFQNLSKVNLRDTSFCRNSLLVVLGFFYFSGLELF